MKIRKAWLVTGVAVATLGMLGLSGCSSSTDSPAEGGKTTLTMWHNSTTGDGKAYWDDAAAASSPTSSAPTRSRTSPV